jgi:hypothetical protein
MVILVLGGLWALAWGVRRASLWYALKSVKCPVCGHAEWYPLNRRFLECKGCHSSYLDRESFTTVQRRHFSGTGRYAPICEKCKYLIGKKGGRVACRYQNRRIPRQRVLARLMWQRNVTRRGCQDFVPIEWHETPEQQTPGTRYPQSWGP